MPQFTDYCIGTILINNSVQLEETEVAITWDPGSKPVHTHQKGFAGMTKGSPFMTIDFKAAVPTSGFEYTSAIDDMLKLKEIPVTLYVGEKTLDTVGILTKKTFNSAVDTESKADYSLMCSYADFQ